nr:MAG TPA: hypothetical protein [Caudoviricetes sp.]
MTTYRNTDTENYTTGVCNIGIGRNRKRKNFLYSTEKIVICSN